MATLVATRAPERNRVSQALPYPFVTSIAGARWQSSIHQHKPPPCTPKPRAICARRAVVDLPGRHTARHSGANATYTLARSNCTLLY